MNFHFMKLRNWNFLLRVQQKPFALTFLTLRLLSKLPNFYTIFNVRPLVTYKNKFKPETNIFLVKRTCCCVGQNFWKNFFFRQANRKNLICHQNNNSKLWRTWSLALLVHNFFIHLNFFAVGEMLLKYGHFDTSRVYYRPILRSILRLTIERCSLFPKLYKVLFWCKGLNRRNEVFIWCSFFKKLPFLN